MNKIIEHLKNKKIAILGFGKEGYSSYKYIRKNLNTIKITIIDRNANLKDKFEELKNDSNLDFVLGDNYLENLEIYDVIIKTPGISLANYDVSKIRNKLTSQLSLVLDYTNAYLIGITGTKGKSTTSTLLHSVISDQLENVYLVGNIGNPILDYIDDDLDNKIYITELSAHQLEFVNTSPKISIILNLYEEHLDYFKTLDNYYYAKLNNFKYQNKDNYALYNYDNETLKSYITKNNYQSKLIPISNKKLDCDCMFLDKNYICIEKNGEVKKLYNIDDERNLKGEFNLINIMFVLKVVDILNLNVEKSIKVINSFNPLRHRLENIGTYNDITFYDDAIATIPEATINAIKSLKNVNTIIFGGLDRGIDYQSIIQYLPTSNVQNLICMPDTGHKIGKILEDSNLKIYYVNNMDEAVDKAFQVTSKNNICLLSPAAPSYNQFTNFEEKGEYFTNLVKHYNK